MSIFGRLFGNGEEEEKKSEEARSTGFSREAREKIRGAATREVLISLDKPSVISLEKGDLLNLSKANVPLSKIHAAAGWDEAETKRADHIDLDLCAHLFAGDKLVDTVYFAHKGTDGVQLDHDNLTGEGDGDDENIYVNLNGLEKGVDRVYLSVVSYTNNTFNEVRNAYIRLIDESGRERELARYNLSADGGNNDSVTAGAFIREGSEWKFLAIGEYSFNNHKIRNLGNKLAEALK